MSGEIDFRVQEVGEIFHLRRAEVEARHAAIGTADAQERAELLAVVVFLHELRAGQIRSARSAARVRAVAEAALLRQKHPPPVHRRGILGRGERLLLSGDGERKGGRDREERKEERKDNGAALGAFAQLGVSAASAPSALSFHHANLTAKPRVGVRCAA